MPSIRAAPRLTDAYWGTSLSSKIDTGQRRRVQIEGEGHNLSTGVHARHEARDTPLQVHVSEFVDPGAQPPSSQGHLLRPALESPRSPDS